jgi:hypothetical protein
VWYELFECCGYWCKGEIADEVVFLLLLGFGSGVCRVRMSFGIVLQLPARKTLNMDGREGVWYPFCVLVWVPSGEGCVGGFGGVLWIGMLGRFARVDGGGVAMPLFRA